MSDVDEPDEPEDEAIVLRHMDETTARRVIETLTDAGIKREVIRVD